MGRVVSCQEDKNDSRYKVLNTKEKLVPEDVNNSLNPATDFIEISVGARHAVPLQNAEIYNVFGEKIEHPPTPFYPTPALPTREGVRVDLTGIASGSVFCEDRWESK